MFSLKDAAVQRPIEAQWLFDFRRCWRWCGAQLLADVSEPRVKGEGVFHWLVGLGIGRGVEERWKRMNLNQSRCCLRHSASAICFVRVELVFASKM
jgi:hypothetical protein